MADFLSGFGRLLGAAAGKTTYKTAEAYDSLRKQILQLTPEQLSAPADASVVAVLMETGYPEAVATLVAVLDGSASLYFSTGGGIIGAGGKPEVSAAARNMVARAADFRQYCAVATEFPLPQKNHIRFYIITPSKILTCEAPETELGNKQHQLSPLFDAGHELIAQMRLADEEKKT